MNLLRLLPPIVSVLLLGAHFYRSGYIILVVIVVLSPLLLLFRHAWAVRIIQVLLVAGSIEWVRTMTKLVMLRQSMGMPWLRLAIILGSVAVVTLLSVYVFRLKALRQRYSLGINS